MRLRLFAVAALVAAAAAAGCGGGGGRDGYVEQFNRADRTLERTLSGIGDDLRAGTSGREVGAKLDESARALDRAAGDFDRIDPPSDAEHAHGRIVDGLRRLAGLFRDSADAARRDDVAGLTRTLEGLESSAGARESQAAQRELKDKGYKVQDR
jgi:hypothetical protein